MDKINALGRRKEASARVKITSGSGKIIINGRDCKVYFPQSIYQELVLQPLRLLNIAEQYDVEVTVIGGGIKGQAEAIRMGISRALVKENPEVKSPLRKAGFMTRDPRSVERKKPGQKKARKRFQFTKR
jgi:small subunit ribosomal protein S9